MASNVASNIVSNGVPTSKLDSGKKLPLINSSDNESRFGKVLSEVSKEDKKPSAEDGKEGSNVKSDDMETKEIPLDMSVALTVPLLLTDNADILLQELELLPSAPAADIHQYSNAKPNDNAPILDELKHLPLAISDINELLPKNLNPIEGGEKQETIDVAPNAWFPTLGAQAVVVDLEMVKGDSLVKPHDAQAREFPNAVTPSDNEVIIPQLVPNAGLVKPHGAKKALENTNNHNPASVDPIEINIAGQNIPSIKNQVKEETLPQIHVNANNEEDEANLLIPQNIGRTEKPEIQKTFVPTDLLGAKKEGFAPKAFEEIGKEPVDIKPLSDSSSKPIITIMGDKMLVSYEVLGQEDGDISTRTQQITVAVKSAALHGKTQVSLTMYPENLGLVDIKIEFNDAKEISSIKIFAEKQETLQLLKLDEANLKDSIKAIVKTDDASLSFNLKDGQNDQAQHEKTESQQPTIRMDSNSSSGLDVKTTHKPISTSDVDIIV